MSLQSNFTAASPQPRVIVIDNRRGTQVYLRELPAVHFVRAIKLLFQLQEDPAAPAAQSIRHCPPAHFVTPNRFKRLTLRERELLQLLAQGLEADAVAQKLRVRPRTVLQHYWLMKTKLGLNNHQELKEYARQFAPHPPETHAA